MTQVPQQYYTPPRKPQASVGAVNIKIYNPTVNPQGQNQYANYPAYPGGYQSAYPLAQNQTANQNVNVPGGVSATSPISNNKTINNANNSATNPPAAKELKSDKKGEKKKKEIVQLTDNYIKTLENYLNNSNADVRLMGAKELLARFKEDTKHRKSDIALTNLLNKALKDPSQGIRLLALSTLDANYATGDTKTIGILKELQKSDSAYNQDALDASRILLKLAGKRVNVTTDELAAKPLKDNKTGQKLNVVST